MSGPVHISELVRRHEARLTEHALARKLGLDDAGLRKVAKRLVLADERKRARMERARRVHPSE